ncbi:P-loop containing nucleoside triphosphate hydrolase protein [Thelephora terrestris]|uniref:P-loop containing nucleoside triphosphate hydrolase protein n=1 Tax=Thelephora terrestris TaxID=56493 RepID=A0A9P6L6X0_9AGAM|nr:P-loop containing nucleoside triphosphate hydrolase protein [Thelephora terrestris]
MLTATKTKTAVNIFSHPQHAQFLAAAASPSSIPKLHGVPEVIVTGRANVGKSSLLNAVLGRRDLLRTSKKPGHTKTLNFYQVGKAPGKAILVDAPGYGGRGRPEWGKLFDHYTENRKELRRIFILFNGGHGLNEIDAMMLQSLDERVQASAGLQFTLQAIITKADTIPDRKLSSSITQLKKDIAQVAPTCLDPIVTSTAKYPYTGINAVRNAIMQACQR